MKKPAKESFLISRALTVFYEIPSDPEIVVKPGEKKAEAIVEQIIDYLEKKNFLVSEK